MKDSKKSRPAPLRKADRQRLATPARERPQVAARLEPSTYRKLAEVAAANGRSVSAEIERQIERSLGPDPGDPDNQLRDLAGIVMRAFERGGWENNAQLEAAEWLKDPLAYQGGIVRVVEALLARHPAPRFENLSLLLVAIRSRLEERLLAVNDPEGRTLPTLDWHTSKQQKDEN